MSENMSMLNQHDSIAQSNNMNNNQLTYDPDNSTGKNYKHIYGPYNNKI